MTASAFSRTLVSLCAAAVILSLPGCGAETPTRPVEGAPPGGPLTETQKIEALIATVEGLTDAVFIRNDEEHTAKEAAGHMRMKWRWKRSKIETARDFIGEAASGSTTSGKVYVIRFGDGREVTSAEFLTATLAKLEAQSAQEQAPKGDR